MFNLNVFLIMLLQALQLELEIFHVKKLTVNIKMTTIT